MLGLRLLLVCSLALMAGCVSVVEPPQGEVTVGEQVANAKRLFLEPGTAPPVKRADGTEVYESRVNVRFSCIDKLVLELPPEQAYTEIRDLLTRLDIVRSQPEQRVASLIRYAGERLFGGFVRSPQRLDQAFENFQRNPSPNAKQLSWLLTCSAADAGRYQLDSAAVVATYKSLRDEQLQLLIVDNIGLCYDAEATLGLLSGELHRFKATSELRYPGLVYALRGYRSLLRVEAAARRALQDSRLPRQHPLRSHFDSADDVPDSLGAVAPVLLAVGQDPKLHQKDMFLLCSFLNDWAQPTLQELADRGIRYDEDSVLHELRKYARPRRRTRG
ncbi:MAG: hypothetical protein AAF581_07130 [Planctomycetota bacterium]